MILAFASSLLLFYIGWGFFAGNPVQGWTSTMLVVVVLSAIQMFVLGMIGEYLGRLYVESKRRPLYLVADVAGPVQGRATLGFKADAPASGRLRERDDRDAGRHRHAPDQVPLQPEDAFEQSVDGAGRG